MSGAWEFLEDAKGRWRWRTSDATGSRESPETFRSGADCVAHALRHGYLAGTWLATAAISPSGKQGHSSVESGSVTN
jgi:hypothetical protein